MDNEKPTPTSKKYFDIYAPVFYPSAIIIILFISLTLLIGKPMETIFANTQSAITSGFGWLVVCFCGQCIFGICDLFFC